MRRVAGTTGEISVSYSFVDGSATNGSDFEGTQDTLTWADGENADQYIQIRIFDDRTDEADENFQVELESSAASVMIAPYSTLTVQILDDDRLDTAVAVVAAVAAVAVVAVAAVAAVAGWLRDA